MIVLFTILFVIILLYEMNLHLYFIRLSFLLGSFSNDYSNKS